jgi:hypothetical protein
MNPNKDWLIIANYNGHPEIFARVYDTQEGAILALHCFLKRTPHVQLLLVPAPAARRLPETEPVKTDQQEYEAWCAAGMPGLIRP